MANVTVVQQWLLELINRIRLDPVTYLQDPNAEAVQPLAFNDILLATSAFHADWMYDNAQFDTTGAFGSSPGDRIAYAGYWPDETWDWGETVDWRSFVPGTQYFVGSLQYNHWHKLITDPGFRGVVMDEDFSELGLAYRLDAVLFGSETYEVSSLTIDYAGTETARFITGRVYYEPLLDWYSEPTGGYAGVQVSTADADTLTGSSGGYEVRVFSDQQTVSIGAATVTLTMPDHSVKIDLTHGGVLKTSASLTVLSGVLEARAIGSADIAISAADTAGAINLYGGIGDNTLIGNKHANRLEGMRGADTMAGGGGNDTYVVRDPGDVVMENAGQGTDTIISSIHYALKSGVAVEVLQIGNEGVYFNINLTGNEFAQRIYGNIFANRLDGGAGADKLYGDYGDDTYIVDNAGDRVYEDQDEGTDTVISSVDFSLVGQYLEILELTGAGDIDGTGNTAANVIRGNSGDNVLDGGKAGDSLYGGLGDDIFIIDNSADRAHENKNEGTDTVLSSVSYSLSGQYVENLTLTGTGHAKATGNSFANVITGNAGSNVINGDKGADTLFGGGGSDKFLFASALHASNVDTILDFTKGRDKIHLDRDIFDAFSVDGALQAGAFKNLAQGAVDVDDRIIFNQGTGDVLYDADGSGAGAAVRFAVLTNGAILAADDFLLV